jgi:hypothetical protein
MSTAAHSEILERLGRAFAKLLAGTSYEKQQALADIEYLDLPTDQVQQAMTLYQEAAEVVGERMAVREEAREAESRRQPQLVKMSTVQSEPVEWLWNRRIARGKLTLGGRSWR